jgi:hypothetical protein
VQCIMRLCSSQQLCRCCSIMHLLHESIRVQAVIAALSTEVKAHGNSNKYLTTVGVQIPEQCKRQTEAVSILQVLHSSDGVVGAVAHVKNAALSIKRQCCFHIQVVAAAPPNLLCSLQCSRTQWSPMREQ